MFGLQIFFFFVVDAMFTDLSGRGLKITYPEDIWVIATRFACAFMMHMNMKRIIRDGLNMMKYANNHCHEFSSPICAYMLGLMQLTGGVIAEFSTVFYMCSLTNPIDIIIRFMALSQIADVNCIIYRAVPHNNRICKSLDPLKVTVHRRDFNAGN